MNLTNLLRDQNHIDLSANPLLIGTRSVKGKTIKFYSDAVVKQSFGMAYTLNYFYTHVANSWGGAGVLIAPPDVDPTPYRVKAHFYTAVGTETYVFVGYAPTSPTGTDDIATKVVAIPSESMEIDEVLLIPPPLAGDVGKPLVIGYAFGANGTGALLCEAHISVQKMDVTAPQFSSSTS